MSARRSAAAAPAVAVAVAVGVRTSRAAHAGQHLRGELRPVMRVGGVLTIRTLTR